MKKYILGRLIQFPLILGVIYVMTFLMVWIVPGSPFENSDRASDPAKLAALQERFHADHWYTFLAYYPYQLIVHQDFGPSLKNQEFSVNDIIKQRAPTSMMLGVVALAIAVVSGVIVGTLSAVYRDGVLDWAGMTLTLVGISVPAFVTAALFLIAFVATLPWFPLGEFSQVSGLFWLLFLIVVFLVGAAVTVFRVNAGLLKAVTTTAILGAFAFLVLDANAPAAVLGLPALVLAVGLWFAPAWAVRVLMGCLLAGATLFAVILRLQQLEGLAVSAPEGFREVILPAIALSLAPMAYIVRLKRVSLLDVLGADYVRTARAKGLSKPMVVIKHCLRNAFLPVLSYLGPAAAVTLTGSFVVERVFALNGLGQAFIDSVTNRDQTMILALVMVYSTLVLSLNLVVDLLYGFVDPRIDVTVSK